jgi:eukaryotic-like serine/threonine-protein kinase
MTIRRCDLGTPRALGVAALLAGSLVLAAVPAPARPAALSSAALTLPKDDGHPTGEYGVRGAGFGSGDVVSVRFDTAVVASALASMSGSFAATFAVPRLATPGPHLLTATGSPSGRTASATFVVRTNWEQFHFSDSHDGVNPYEFLLGRTNVSALRLAWATQTDVSSLWVAGVNSPVVFDGFVYVTNTEGRVLALRESDGAVAWSVETGADLRSAPTVYHDHLYVSGDRLTICLRLRDGKVLWTAEAGNATAAPTPEDGVIYVGGGPLTALDADTGATLWSYAAEDEFHGSPTVEHGVVTAGSIDYHAYALDARTGAVLWTARPTDGVQDSDEVFGATAVAGGRVFFADIVGRVFALDEATGATRWVAPMGEGDAFASPTVVGGLVIAGAADGLLYAFNAKTGALAWTAVTTPGSDIPWAAAAANGVVYTGSSDGSIYGFDAGTGARLWSAATGGGVYSSPAVTNGSVFVGSGDGKVYAYRLP